VAPFAGYQNYYASAKPKRPKGRAKKRVFEDEYRKPSGAARRNNRSKIISLQICCLQIYANDTCFDRTDTHVLGRSEEFVQC
jgi:hypothetical protein